MQARILILHDSEICDYSDRLLGTPGDRECWCSRLFEGSIMPHYVSRPSFHSLQLSAPPVRSARPR